VSALETVPAGQASPTSRTASAGGTTLRTVQGIAVPWDYWIEVNSRAEGHFRESFSRGAFSRYLSDSENSRGVRLLLDHGQNPIEGQLPVGVIDELRDSPEGLAYTARLFPGPYRDQIEAAVMARQMGSSVRFAPMRMDRNPRPARSASNPQGIPEHRVHEAQLREISLTTFPAYKSPTMVSLRFATATTPTRVDAALARELELRRRFRPIPVSRTPGGSRYGSSSEKQQARDDVRGMDGIFLPER
jgi:HK97 family phage prohead protease